MRQLFSSVFIAASVFAMAGLSSCSNENEPGMTPPEGEKGIPTAMSLTLNMNGVQTRADQNPGGLVPEDYTTPGETVLKTLHVYIYDAASGALQKFHDLTYTDGAAGSAIVDNGNGTYTTEALDALTGNKKIYVGLNLTTAMTTVLEKADLITLQTSAVQEELANMASSTTGFSMFSPSTAEGNFKASADGTTVPAENHVTASVERMVAKIGVGATTNPKELGAAGAVKDLKWALDNIGKKFYVPATKSDPSMTAGEWLQEDFVNYDFNGDDQPVDLDPNLQNVEVNADRTQWTTDYSTENFVEDNKLKGMTRVVVKGTYTPAQEITYTLDQDGTLKKAAAALTEGVTYYQIVIPNDNKYVFLATKPDAIALAAYYKKVTSQDYAGADITQEDYVKEYTNGANYWWVTMKETGSDGNVERNHVYLANINSITFPGRTEGEFNDKKDDDKELEQETLIDVTVNVLDWYMVTFDTDLKP